MGSSLWAVDPPADDAGQAAERAQEAARYAGSRLEGAPPMAFSPDGEAIWRKQAKIGTTDPLTQGALDFAERWARMMQVELAEGRTVEDVWKATSHAADLEAMSGHSMAWATHLLTLCWIHGMDLRRAYNAHYGSASTHGTIDPTIIDL